MITKGIITSINVWDNTCTVRIPLFETAGNLYKNESSAIICVPPGVYNGLQVDDVVIVGFEDNNSGKPVILGKLYLGISKESEVKGGSGQFDTLVVSEKVTLPADTTISFIKNDKKIQNDEIQLNSLNSLSDIISAIKENNKSILDIKNSISEYSDELKYIGKWTNGDRIFQKTLSFDFQYLNIGQTQNASWYYEIPFSYFGELSVNGYRKLVFDYSFITTSSTPKIINPVCNSARTSAYEFYASVENNKLILLGTTSNYTLRMGYITINYFIANE